MVRKGQQFVTLLVANCLMAVLPTLWADGSQESQRLQPESLTGSLF